MKMRFEQLREEIQYLRCNDDVGLDLLVKKAKLYISKSFGQSSHYIVDIDNISYHNMFADTFAEQMNAWEEGKKLFTNVIDTIMLELELVELQDERKNAREESPTEVIGKDIFIVHGHDEVMKHEVARTLEKLDLHPIILHEQPDKGRNVLTKLIEESACCGFAIILLSPDDYGYPVKLEENDKKTRARQNVVLELGYFIGKLGTDRVVALYREDSNFDMPSDYAGTLYKKYGSDIAWKVELTKELKAAGFNVDMNKLIG